MNKILQSQLKQQLSKNGLNFNFSIGQVSSDKNIYMLGFGLDYLEPIL